MSEIVKMSGGKSQTSIKIFRFFGLPQELQDAIVSDAVVKPDGYIGQAPEGGVECAQGVYNSTLVRLPADGSCDDDTHFPVGCRHPAHERKQFLQDFREYRSINLALTCKRIYKQVNVIFFKENGFELRSVSDGLRFFNMIGNHHDLIHKVRLYHDLLLHEHHFHWLFGSGGPIRQMDIYHMFEEEYLHDDEPGTDFVNTLTHLKTCDKIQNFELIYRLVVPGQCFQVASGSGHFGYAPTFGSYWFGEDMHWEVRVQGLWEKLRQDNAERADQFLAVRPFLRMNSLAQAVGHAWGMGNEFWSCAEIMKRACVAHVENCIEL